MWVRPYIFRRTIKSFTILLFVVLIADWLESKSFVVKKFIMIWLTAKNVGMK